MQNGRLAVTGIPTPHSTQLFQVPRAEQVHFMELLGLLGVQETFIIGYVQCPKGAAGVVLGMHTGQSCRLEGSRNVFSEQTWKTRDLLLMRAAPKNRKGRQSQLHWCKYQFACAGQSECHPAYFTRVRWSIMTFRVALTSDQRDASMICRHFAPALWAFPVFQG